MDKSGYKFTLDLQVRDYECDMQGIVNNAVYQNYIEHARHEFLKYIGVDFADYTARKIYLVVVRAELDYKKSLKSGDKFWVGVNTAIESNVKFAFYQDIYNSEGNLCLKAKIIGTALNERGRPAIPKEFAELL